MVHQNNVGIEHLNMSFSQGNILHKDFTHLVPWVGDTSSIETYSIRSKLKISSFESSNFLHFSSL